uniref:helix-turn-helix domain-containing protein n=1 Tax=Faecousia sp. TaxID=2952921 RepID=UPI0040292C09
MSIGERITELRKAASLSQGQLAQRMGVTRQAVSKWENDLSTPDPLRLVQLADALGTDSEYLASGQHATLPSPPVVVHSVEEKPVYVEKIVEKPVYIEKPAEPQEPKVVIKEVPVDRVVQRVVEKPVIQKVVRYRYRADPVMMVLAAIGGLVVGLVIGLLI